MQSWKDGGGETTNATTTYKYVWRDGPLTSAVTLSNKDGATQSLYAYDDAGRLQSVTLTGGLRPRTVAFTTDLGGQVLTRDEVPQYANAPAANPHARRYYFEGVEMGQVGNDGTDDTTMADAVARSRAAEPPAGTTANPPGPFRNGATAGSAYASFDRQYDAVNVANVETAPQSYTVRGGDTLASVAQQVWGDANLWYLIAQANGLTGSEQLATGQLLTIPSTVTNRGNTTDSYRPYDPAEALGDVQPNTPVPQPRAAPAARKKNKCGIFGAILLAVVAVAVTVVTAGAATPVLSSALGSTLGGIVGGAVGAAAGSVVSQGVGIATGIQDKFSFKGVALAAISGGVGAGVGAALGSGAIGGSQLLGNVVRGVAGSALTQGIAVATGLQKRFSWSGVAAADVGAAVGTLAGGLLGTRPLTGESADTSIGNYAARLGQSGAALIANAATRSVIDGSDFGDNVLAALPDVIAQTVGDIIFNGVKGGRRGSEAQSDEARAARERVAAARTREELSTLIDQLEPDAIGELRAVLADRARAAAGNAPRGTAQSSLQVVTGGGISVGYGGDAGVFSQGIIDNIGKQGLIDFFGALIDTRWRDGGQGASLVFNQIATDLQGSNAALASLGQLVTAYAQASAVDGRSARAAQFTQGADILFAAITPEVVVTAARTGGGGGGNPIQQALGWVGTALGSLERGLASFERSAGSFLDANPLLRNATAPLWAPQFAGSGFIRAGLRAGQGLTSLVAHPQESLLRLAGGIDRVLLDDRTASEQAASLYNSARRAVASAGDRLANASVYDILSGAGGVVFDVGTLVAPGGAVTRLGRVGEVVSVGNRGVALAASERALVGASEGRLVGGTFDIVGDTSRLSLSSPRLSGFENVQGTIVSGRSVHPNSLDYVGDTHVYAIRGPDGSLYKVGESTQGVRVSDGASIRAEQQVRKLFKDTGDVYTSEIRAEFTNKADARAYETRFIQTYTRLYGRPPGNPLNR